MTCINCLSLLKGLNLEENNYVTLKNGDFNKFAHNDLLVYDDYNNGVSEGSTEFICKTCATFFEMHYHISMEEGSSDFEVIRKPTEQQVSMAANVLALTNFAEEQNKSFVGTDRLSVYFVTDVAYTTSRIETETPLYNLEALLSYGFNHKGITDNERVSLSLEDLIRNLGANDNYAKKTFFIRLAVPKESIEAYASISSYADPSISYSTNHQVDIKDMVMIDPLTDKEWPLNEISLSECFDRDHDEYLTAIRIKQSHVDDDPRKILLDKLISDYTAKLQLKIKQ